MTNELPQQPLAKGDTPNLTTPWQAGRALRMGEHGAGKGAGAEKMGEEVLITVLIGTGNT